MQLNLQITGSGAPLIIIHGLFGTLQNWNAQTKALAEHFTVYAVDLRNHGRSPHTETNSYQEMADDIIELMDQQGLNSAHILGHSMGGKVAMQLAMNNPERVDKLIIVDIAPVQYPNHHSDVFAGLNAVDLENLSSRREADQQLSQHIPELAVRQFLLTNLYRNDAKQFAWRMNIPTLEACYDEISKAPTGPAFDKPVLFIKGENSDYITPAYRDQILSLFPQADYRMIQGSGHWPHAEKAAIFTKLVLHYLMK
ncbi:alpha/beta fold hydrolase [Amphritea opalescens]|uniref:Alpha/beta fold hydrolase n=1 Tax=Amphritea opalescens TaxID=2490544 RepID=A0A430KNM6_9GAMM|nr:alpha/beta fold hydrolase [Amphritea opalescens]RTE65098.1 alpha/beta fold hydrolase [Amphritea opalescens]